MIRVWPSILAGAVVVALTLGTLLAVAMRAEAVARPWLSSADWAAIRFTLWQAFLSALISCALAIPVSRALARRRFPGRAVLLTLLGAPFILPVIVAVFGLLAVFGRHGVVATGLGWLGLPPVPVYGLQGVVLAHVFFNLPLAARLILQGWASIPAEQFRLAASLDFRARDVARLIERPMLRQVLPGAFMVIFLICITSFAVALTLGGGPRATTVELAIYQAFRFDFDLGRAALLAVVQFAICAAAAGAMSMLKVPDATPPGLGRPLERPDARRPWLRLQDAAWLLFAAAFLLLPLGAVALHGAAALQAGLPAPVLQAAGRSLLLSLSVAVLAMLISLPLAFAVVAMRNRPILAAVLEGTGYLALAASPLVVGTGLFLVLHEFADPARLALPVTALVNAVASLPFALRALVPAIGRSEARFGKMADVLGLSGWQRVRVLHLPLLRPVLGFAAGLAAALSMGDLGVITLFAAADGATLPLELYRLMAAYRMETAAGAALLLLIMALGVFWFFDRGGRLDAET